MDKDDEISSLLEEDDVTVGLLTSDDDDDVLDLDIEEFNIEPVNDNDDKKMNSTTFGGTIPMATSFSSPFSAITGGAVTNTSPFASAIVQPATNYSQQYNFGNSYNNYPNWYNNTQFNNTITNINSSINYRKKILFISMYDTIACSIYSYRNNSFIPNIPINNVTDLIIRKEVLDKLKKFVPDIIYVIVPKQLFVQISNSSSLELKSAKDLSIDINNLTGYMRLFISSYLRLTATKKCQFILFDDMDYRSVASVIKNTIETLNNSTNNSYSKEQVGFIGTCSGNNGYNASDLMIAEEASIDFIDTNVLLRC